ncbi:MAG: LuxR C-terminal-related transcriptional regulator [Pseudomonadota bacterium]
MQVWSVPTVSPRTPVAAQRDVAAALVGCIARNDFATRALAEVNRAIPVAWWTIYRVFDDQPPQLFVQASHAVPDIALDCWRIYRSGVYRDDTHFADACEQAGQGDTRTVMTHCLADDFGRAHREQIYAAHSLSERLSVVSAERVDDARADSRGALLAVNLYRHRAQPRFAPRELDTVLEVAGTLLAVVQRHIELGSAQLTAVQRLQQLCPQLTPRELAVCERLLRGLTFEGIGVDLGVSAATAKTYRNRAFERLGIHHRNELFALALAAAR